MSLYKHNVEGCHGGFTPEDKAEALADMRENTFLYKPSDLLRDAEWIGILPDLLDFSAKELDKRKIDYISSSYFLLTQIENLIREDDKDKFVVFLTANYELVHDFPTSEVFFLLCWNNAPACVSALLDSPLRVDVDINSFGLRHAYIPLDVAAAKLSLPLTQTLLAHGANANAYPEHSSFPTVLDTALLALRSHKLVEECSVKHNAMDLIFTLRNSDLEEGVGVISVLAFHTNNLESVLSRLIYDKRLTEMVILMFVAWKKLLVPSDLWTLKSTPLAKHISKELKQVEFEYDEMAKIEKKIDLNDAYMVAKSVWKACNKFKVKEHSPLLERSSSS